MSNLTPSAKHSSPGRLDTEAVRQSWIPVEGAEHCERVGLFIDDYSEDSNEFDVAEVAGSDEIDDEEEINARLRPPKQLPAKAAAPPQQRVPLREGAPSDRIQRCPISYALTAEGVDPTASSRSGPSTIHERRYHTGFTVRAEITRVINGTFLGRPSTFIGLVTTPDDSSIVERSEITATIRPYDNSIQSDPMIIRYSPKQLYGEASEIEETSSFEFGVSLDSGNLPVTPGVSATRSQTTTATRQVRRWVRCFTKTPPHGQTRSILVLQTSENPVQKDGIHSELPIGFIVDHEEQPFALTVEVMLKRRFWDSMFPIVAKPYTDSSPALFDGKVGLLRPSDTAFETEMDQWSEDTWRSLVSYPEGYENVVYGE